MSPPSFVASSPILTGYNALCSRSSLRPPPSPAVLPSRAARRHAPTLAITIDPPASLTSALEADLAVSHFRDAVSRIEAALSEQTDYDSRVLPYAILHDLLQRCARGNHFALALRTLSVIERTGFVTSRATSCTLLNALSRAGRLADCERLLDQLSDPRLILFDGTVRLLTPEEAERRAPDEKAVAAVAHAATSAGLPHVAVRVLDALRDRGGQLTHFSYSVLFRALGRVRASTIQGRARERNKSSSSSDSNDKNSSDTVLGRKNTNVGNDSALDLVKATLEAAILEPPGTLDAIALDAAVDALARCGDPQAALRATDLHEKLGCELTARSFNPVARALARDADYDGVEEVVRRMAKCGVEPSARTRNALLSAYARAGRFQEAREQLVELAKDARARTGDPMSQDVCVGFAALAGELARQGQVDAATAALKELARRVHQRKDEDEGGDRDRKRGKDKKGGKVKEGLLEREVGIAVAAVVGALLERGDIVRGWTLFRGIRTRFQVQAGPDMYNTVVRGLSKRGDRLALSAASEALDEMIRGYKNGSCDASEEQVRTAFNALVDGHVRCGDATGAEERLDEMSALGVAPDVVSYTSVMDGFGRELDLLSARRVLIRMRQAGVKADLTAMNALLGACVRVGDVAAAERVFNGIQSSSRDDGALRPNVVSYSAMIAAFVRDNQLDRAWEMYEQMKRVGLRANERLLERLMAAFVTPKIKPNRGEVWGVDDGEEENGNDKANANANANELANKDDDGVEEEEEEEELEQESTQTEMLDEEERRRLLGRGGWSLLRAQTLLRDMDTARCSEVNRRRWSAAIDQLLKA